MGGALQNGIFSNTGAMGRDQTTFDDANKAPNRTSAAAIAVTRR